MTRASSSRGARSEIVVPGEFLVQLPFSESLASTATPRGRRTGRHRVRRRLRWVKRFDDLLEKVHCVEVRRVHEPLRVGGGRNVAIRRRMDSTFLVRVDPDRIGTGGVIDTFRDSDLVDGVEANRLFLVAAERDDASFAFNSMALQQIGAAAALSQTVGDPTVFVAVLDTGVEILHPLLATAFAGGIDTVDLRLQNPPPGKRWAGDFKHVDPDPTDDVGHGTHIAGIISAGTTNGGAAPGCRFLAIRVLARLENINGVPQMLAAGKSDDIARGIRAAVDRGARVINMSYANAAADAPGVLSLLERNELTLAVQRGVLPVAAMGNLGPAAPMAFPAGASLTLPVVAVGAIDEHDQRLPQSQTGPHLSVVAPGRNIVSTLPGGLVGLLSGTSMATAYVSAAAALAQSLRRKSQKPLLTPVALKSAILASARHLGPGGLVRNDEFGYGCLNMNALLNMVKTMP